MNGDDIATLRLKFSRFDWDERRCLIEALVLLAVAAAAVRLLPLSFLGRMASAGPFRPTPADADREEAITWAVSWAVDRAAKRSLFRSLCFEQGLAAQIMLRRRGIDSTLFYGVAPDPGALRPIRAHVWVETTRFPVVGHPDPGAFALLAAWPAGRQTTFAKCAA